MEAAAEASSAQARTDIQRATNYVLGVVLFAAVLFFAGISTKIVKPADPHGDLGLVGPACFAGAAAWIATFPVSFSI